MAYLSIFKNALVSKVARERVGEELSKMMKGLQLNLSDLLSINHA